MDKFEYKIRAEEINALIEKKEYAEAVKIADTIDWRRVRSVVMLCKVSELYKMNRRYEDSKEVLLLAYDLKPNSRKIVYSLCELAIKLEETVQAVEYYKEFIQIAPRDTGRFILQYRLYEAQDVSLEERIAVLEEYKKRDYREKWAYELAYLYHRIGLATRCVEECDELILWFGDGKYVIKALELKMLHAPLTPEQQEKYNARFMVPAQEAEPEPSSESEQTVEGSLPIEIKAVEATRAKTEEIPSRKVRREAESSFSDTKEFYGQEDPVLVNTDAQYEADDDVKEYEMQSRTVSEEEPVDDSLSEEPVKEAAEEAVSADENDEDADMKIVNPNEDLDIQVKTIDVDDAYNTINLQEELAKNLAKMLAEEDMEASDATRALPVDSIFQATSEAGSSTDESYHYDYETEELEEIEESGESVEGEEFGESELSGDDDSEESAKSEKVEETEGTKAEDSEETEKAGEFGIAKASEWQESGETGEAEETAESIETEELEEIEEPTASEEPAESEESAEIEESGESELSGDHDSEDSAKSENIENLEEIEKTKKIVDIKEIGNTYGEEDSFTEDQEQIEEKIAEEEISGEDVLGADIPEEEISEEETLEEEISREERLEIPEEKVPEKEIEPLFFQQNNTLSDELIKAVQTVAMEAAKEAARQAAQEAAQATAMAMKEIQPDHMTESAKDLEAEPQQAEEPEPEVSKQITGQLSFSDIMAEWEETKKANEEKHLQEMKQRVLEQTGPLFSSFDEQARASVQSDLDMLSPMIDVFSDTEDLATEVEDALASELGDETDHEDTDSEALLSEEPAEDAGEYVGEAVAQEPEQAAEDAESEDTEDRPSSFNTEEINGLEDKLMTALSEQHYETANIQSSILEKEIASYEEQPSSDDEQTQKPETQQDEAQPETHTLTKTERKIFGSIAQTKELREQIAAALSKVSLLPYSGNIIVTGENGTGALEIAQNIVLDLTETKRGFSGKSVVYQSSDLEGKDILQIVKEVANGALIIDHAGDLSADLCNRLMKAGNEQEENGIVFIFVDTQKDIERLGRSFPKLPEYFDARIDITVLDNDGLVKFGQEYAKDKEFSIDEMGVLALYNRIEERQTSEHAVTVEEVKEIINGAIQNAEKKNLSHFMDVIFAKRYDKEDMIVLREKDFM